jgi:hypothetical protein
MAAPAGRVHVVGVFFQDLLIRAAGLLELPGLEQRVRVTAVGVRRGRLAQ